MPESIVEERRLTVTLDVFKYDNQSLMLFSDMINSNIRCI